MGTKCCAIHVMWWPTERGSEKSEVTILSPQSDPGRWDSVLWNPPWGSWGRPGLRDRKLPLAPSSKSLLYWIHFSFSYTLDSDEILQRSTKRQKVSLTRRQADGDPEPWSFCGSWACTEQCDSSESEDWGLSSVTKGFFFFFFKVTNS